jgi:hypothetical protein
MALQQSPHLLQRQRLADMTLIALHRWRHTEGVVDRLFIVWRPCNQSNMVKIVLSEP